MQSRVKTSRGNHFDGCAESKLQNDLGGINKKQEPNSIQLEGEDKRLRAYEAWNCGKVRAVYYLKNTSDGI